MKVDRAMHIVKLLRSISLRCPEEGRMKLASARTIRYFITQTTDKKLMWLEMLKICRRHPSFWLNLVLMDLTSECRGGRAVCKICTRCKFCNHDLTNGTQCVVLVWSSTLRINHVLDWLIKLDIYTWDNFKIQAFFLDVKSLMTNLTVDYYHKYRHDLR